MKRHTVEKIKEQAQDDISHLKGKRGDYILAWTPTAQAMRRYSKKVLFLCREIEKLRKKVKK